MQFADTKVLLYAISKDPAEAGKARVANDLLDSRDVALSTQVLQEFYVQATRAGRADRLSGPAARALVESFCRFPVAPTTSELVLAAAVTAERYRISYWDAAIIEACRSLACEVVLSEDLPDGQDYGGVRVRNPFRDA